MAKKILSTVLAIVMLMSILAVGASAISFKDYELGVNCILCGALESNGSEAGWKTKLAGYLAKDPDIIERNLAFWDDDIIDEYHAASTTAQWKALYNKMREGVDSYDGPLDDYYPLYRYTAADKAAVDVKYEVTSVLDDTLTAREGLDVVKPGDTVMVTVSVKSNFLIYSLDLGVIYEYNNVEFNSDIGVSTYLGDNWEQTGSDNPNYGCPGYDARDLIWPASMRDNANGEYDTYKLAKVSYSTKGSAAVAAEEFDTFTPVFVFPFKVLEGVDDGTVLNFFNVEDASFSIDNLEIYEVEYGGEAAFVSAYRSISPVIRANPDGTAHFDHEWTFENTSITVGEAAPVLPADYDALDAAIAEFDANTDAADYTAASWAAYADAAADANAVDRDLTADDQQIIDDATAALTGAKNALVKNEVKSATVAGSPVIGSNATVNVVVDGEPSLLRFVKSDDTFLTFASDSENVTITNNSDGTQTWAVKVFADSESATYEVFAKYANFTDNGVTVTINATEGLDLSIHSIIVKDMYPNNMNGGTVTKGKHTIIITTSTDVSKIQFVDPMGTIEAGSTFTYEPKNVAGNCKYEDKDGERTWTITHSFGPMGEWSMPIRTRAESTTFITTDTNLTARVVY